MLLRFAWRGNRMLRDAYLRAGTWQLLLAVAHVGVHESRIRCDKHNLVLYSATGSTLQKKLHRVACRE